MPNNEDPTPPPLPLTYEQLLKERDCWKRAALGLAIGNFAGSAIPFDKQLSRARKLAEEMFQIQMQGTIFAEVPTEQQENSTDDPR